MTPGIAPMDTQLKSAFDQFTPGYLQSTCSPESGTSRLVKGNRLNGALNTDSDDESDDEEWSETHSNSFSGVSSVADFAKENAGSLMTQVHLVAMQHTMLISVVVQVLQHGMVKADFCGGEQKYCDSGDNSRAIKGSTAL